MTTPIRPLEELLALVKEANEVIDHTDLSWRAKYDLVFSGAISGRIYILLPGFSPSDPDTTYREDVTAFVSQLNEYLKEVA